MSDARKLSPSGVLIKDDFRSNLIIDRYDPVFEDMRASKIKHLRSVNSEDAVTWNVFRSIRQIEPGAWFPFLWPAAFPNKERPNCDRLAVKLWMSVDPPLGLLEGGDEGSSEIDVVLESPTWVWFIEAKYRSDISMGTTTRPDRDQIIRNIDVGSYYAGVRDFYFSLLIADPSRSPQGVKKIAEYEAASVAADRLKLHRPDGVTNLKGIGLLTWSVMRATLQYSLDQATRQDERAFAQRAVDWMVQRSL